MKRLKNAYFGQWIDPSQPVQFTFEGELIHGVEGDTVASALLANDQWLQSRSLSTTVREGH
jgi:sarcosine oxidase subunit alpha